jgi:hypothetical protein
LAAAQFPVFSAEPGNFLLFHDKCRFSTEDSEPDQTVAGKFPSLAKRELNPPNRELRELIARMFFTTTKPLIKPKKSLRATEKHTP